MPYGLMSMETPWRPSIGLMGVVIGIVGGVFRVKVSAVLTPSGREVAHNPTRRRCVNSRLAEKAQPSQILAWAVWRVPVKRRTAFGGPAQHSLARARNDADVTKHPAKHAFLFGLLFAGLLA